MADFCWDCYDEMFGEPAENDLLGLCEDGEHLDVLCEGCGAIVVNSMGKKVGVSGLPLKEFFVVKKGDVDVTK